MTPSGFDSLHRQAEELVDALGGRRVRDGFMVLCPAHADREPSLHLTVTGEKLLLKCFAGCEQDAVLEELRRRGLWDSPSQAVFPGEAKGGSSRAAGSGRDKADVPVRAAASARDRADVPVRPRSRKLEGPPEAIYVYHGRDGWPRHRTLRFPHKRFAQQSYHDGTWEWRLNRDETVLYRLPELLAAPPDALVFVPEGEKDAERVASLGLVATTAAMGTQGWQPHYSQWLRDRDVVILADNDAAGRDAAEVKARALAGVARRVRVLTLPDLPEHGDVSDWLDRGGTRDRLIAMAQSAPEWDDTQRDAPRLVTLSSMVEVQEEAVTWLWFPYIPFGKLTIMEGDPGAGKSWEALAIATAVTRGAMLPGDDRSARDPGRVLLLMAEDGLADTVKPRLLSLGADLSRLRPVIGILKNDQETPMMLSEDGLAALEREVARYRPSLVILDPLIAYLNGKVDTHRANEVRSVLRPLGDMAQRHGTAVLALRHLTKAPGGHALYRGQGSIDFTAIARSVLLVGRDPDDMTLHIMVPTKASLTELGPAQGFRISSAAAGGRFVWEGQATLTAQQLLAPAEGTDGTSALAEAKAFLSDALLEAPCAVRDVQKWAREAGIAEITLRRAKEDLGVRAVRQGGGRRGGGCWLWELPSIPQGTRGHDHLEHLKENGVHTGDEIKAIKMIIEDEEVVF